MFWSFTIMVQSIKLKLLIFLFTRVNGYHLFHNFVSCILHLFILWRKHEKIISTLEHFKSSSLLLEQTDHGIRGYSSASYKQFKNLCSDIIIIIIIIYSLLLFRSCHFPKQQPTTNNKRTRRWQAMLLFLVPNPSVCGRDLLEDPSHRRRTNKL